MNLEFLRQKIESKFGTIDAFSDAINVSRPSVSKWLNGHSEPMEDRLLDIINSLDLNDEDVDVLMNIPPTQVSFRKTGMSEIEAGIMARAKDLAETFFKIDGTQYGVRNFLSLSNEQDVTTIASYIRTTLLEMKREDEPVTLAAALMQLKKHNINVFFLPFQKLGLAEDRHFREVAFFVRKGPRAIIFADTNRTLDQSVFDICHEIAHLVLNHKNPTKSEESMCNKIAQELIFPRQFFLNNQGCTQTLVTLTEDTRKYYETVYELYQEYEWSPLGIALALKEYGYIKQSSLEFKLLQAMSESYQKQVPTIDTEYFSGFDTKSFTALNTFFTKQVTRKKDFYKPFIELKTASIFGRLSPRRLGEILNIDSGDADELIRSWSLEDESLSAMSNAINAAKPE